MKRKLAGSLAAVAVLTLGIAACSSSSPTSSSGSEYSAGSSNMGKTADDRHHRLSPMIQRLQPVHGRPRPGTDPRGADLYNQPLIVFNTQNAQRPRPRARPRTYAWSNGGKTLTITTRSGVKWSDGKPFSASDVAYTFNLIKSNAALNASWTIPVPASATATNSTTTVLTFSQPELSNLYYLLQVPIVPQHIWSERV